MAVNPALSEHIARQALLPSTENTSYISDTPIYLESTLVILSLTNQNSKHARSDSSLRFVGLGKFKHQYY